MSRRSRRWFLGAAAASLTVGCVGSGPGLAPTVGPADLTPAEPTPVRPGTVVVEATPAHLDALTVYTALGRSLAGGAATELERIRPGLAVQVVSLPTAEQVQARIRQEKGAPKGDVFLGGPSQLHDALARESLLATYRSLAADAVPPQLKDPAGAWTGFYASVLGTIVNRDRFAGEAGGASAPEGWDDLLSPAFKGRIALPDPAHTSAGYLFLSGQVGRLGDEAKALDFMKKLHENGASYQPTEAAALEAVGKGPALVAVGWHQDVLDAQDRNEPLGFTAPPAALIEVGAVSLIKGGPNPDGGKALIDYLLGRDGAQLVVGVGNRPSTVRGAPSPAGLAPLEGSTLAPYDRAWATDNRARLVKAWQGALGRPAAG